MALKISLLVALVCIAALISMSEAAPQRKANDNDDIKEKLEDAKKQFDDLADKMEALAKILPEIHRQSQISFSRKFTGVLGLPPKTN